MAPTTSAHLLILEDNPDDEALILRALRELPAAPTTTVARDGLEALELLRKPNARIPDLILVDLKMPRMTGFDFLHAMRAEPRFRHLPLVVFTSSDDATDVERAYAAGANAYVQKPIDFTAFSTSLNAIIQFWLRTNEPPRPTSKRLQQLL